MKAPVTTKTILVLSVFLLGGCGSQPLFQVETVVHGNGSCDRTIWQPEGEMLPPEAVTKDWKSRWAGIKKVDGPPAFDSETSRDDSRKYFTATGSFPNPAEIPVHFFNRVEIGLESDVGVLNHSYERIDHTFVIEHRWRETLTNITSREGFAKARDQAIGIVLERMTEGLRAACDSRYNCEGLTHYVRGEGRRFLQQATDLWFEHSADHRPEEELPVRLSLLAQNFGLDLLDASGKVVAGEDLEERLARFLRHRVVLGVRHRDGRRLAESEIQALTDPQSNSSLSLGLVRYWKAHQHEVEARLSALFLRMIGLYNHPLGMSGSGNPKFAFSVMLPGEIVESNGEIAGMTGVRWRFDGDRSFPGGFTMEARSLEIDSTSQERILGRVAVKDRDQALALFRELESSESIREAMGKLRSNGSCRPLEELTPIDEVDRERLTRVRRILGFGG